MKATLAAAVMLTAAIGYPVTTLSGLLVCILSVFIVTTLYDAAKKD